ncbi:NAD(P)-dependent dehydrogenase (short-subunit alcohol dehydrogenase family) [Jatrophihabitans sp. GAS493]|uniref:SDR family NAD(P)-dependent oxidoreductase n=1 Tax=Jatrophihabitans sp. GAS493 TaxID=1907575 RepID=UPI000BB7D6BE|nr:SDR family NAD(P)-dependent oxidoreductase [Jatrophihabitans sp. GAS493]SOD74681.1 NAD(P)-dependent dehydrogenase (short-subunit alcohol dehydrogenase family) [Jatrophihabitans sp. GAS493]
MQVSMHDRVALVTGAGRGLGRAYALDLARHGATVVVNDVGGSLRGDGTDPDEPPAADQVVAEIVALGGSAIANYDSVASPEGGEAMVELAMSTYGRLDAVINNAGILRDRTMGKLDWDDVGAVLDVHLRGAFHVTQPAFREMRKAGYGRLVFTSSNAGTFGNFGQSVYGAAKAALVGLSGATAIEGERYGIRSNVVCPIARTRMTESMLGPLAAALDPEQVAPLVTYLCSEDCERTHAVYSAGGGHFARVFTDLTSGWQAPSAPTADMIADALGEIEADGELLRPESATDELTALATHLRSAAGSL